MKHLGDITKLRGSEVPLVDIVVGGSPCQNLSIAGNRKGLQGEQSGLFIEQIRIIKEMRENSQRSSWSNKSIRPRYMVWENVPGALSSNNGEDFRIVLEETAKIADENAVIPRPPGKWTGSGCIMADGWSIAWRIHDAQFWGVPQRRRRIALVADFGGQSAPEILFERESVSGDIAESGEEREGTAAEAEGGIGRSDSVSLKVFGISPYASNAMKSKNPHSGIYEAETSRTLDLNGGNPACNQGGMVVCVETPIMIEMTSTKNTVVENGTCPTLTARMGTGGNQVNAVCYSRQKYDEYKECECAVTITAHEEKEASNCVCSVDVRNGTENPDINGTLQAKSNGGTSLNLNNVVRTQHMVRRLTPLECERLQGYPDGWTDIGDWTDTKGKKRKLSDTARYKALGNSIALPFWEWMAKRICAQYDRPATMASLFDGIGGFPLVFSRCGCKPVWASEIEPFCVAVTRKRFPDEEKYE